MFGIFRKEKTRHYARFYILVEAIIKTAVFLGVTPWSLVGCTILSDESPASVISHYDYSFSILFSTLNARHICNNTTTFRSVDTDMCTYYTASRQNHTIWYSHSLTWEPQISCDSTLRYSENMRKNQKFWANVKVPNICARGTVRINIALCVYIQHCAYKYSTVRINIALCV
jgi:hypothetical protein